MNKELVISSTAGDTTIALLEEKQLVELNSEKKDQSFQVGDIYLGRVRKLIPSLNAAFVDVGHEKDAFLHYLDLGPQVKTLQNLVKLTTTGKNPDPMLSGITLEKDIEKSGKINSVLSANQWVMVQVAKEPISTKGPRITAEISMAGRYVVLVPFTDVVSISQKIKSSEERQRLKRLAMSIKPRGFGLIVRTVAEGKKTAELDQDIQDLVTKWKTAFSNLSTAKPPQKILGELNRTSTILRDLLNANFNAIHVNDPSLFDEIRTYIQTIMPEQTEIVKLYKGKQSIFEHFGIEKQIKSTFGKTVNMANGAYLIVEHTEAMHVIDVNSGGRVKSSEGEASQENIALQVNMDAAREIARQLRLRDMGGIIVVDFIDLHNPANRKTLFDQLRNEMKRDRAKHTILPPSKFGLVQITRQRVRPETNITTVEKCPACDGTGEIKASILLVDEIENKLRYFVQEQNEKELVIQVHPYLEAYLNKGVLWNSQVSQWKKKYKAKLKVLPNTAYHVMEYRFFNRIEEEIKT